MSAGLPDLVDCARLAEGEARLRRVYEFGELPRLGGLLAESQGTLSAEFTFVKLPSGRPGAAVSIETVPQLVCQRCLQGFSRPVSGGSEIEFAESEAAQATDPGRELFVMRNGLVSLRALAEEEMLLALPIAPACDTPVACGNAPGYVTGDETPGVNGAASPEQTRRPFGALQDLLKKT
jgi:uncharacterized metal-binding protein YceD (DUF177 family)